jgi:hypothetical protein
VLVAAFAVSLAMTVLGVVMLTVRPTTSVRLAVGASPAVVHFGRLRPGFFVGPPGAGGGPLQVRPRVGVFLPPALRGRGARLEIAAPLPPPSLRGTGWTLLGVGLLGIVLTLALWWWLGRGASRPPGDDLVTA